MATKTRKPRKSIHDRPPENMTAAIIAKCHAENMIHLTGEKLQAVREQMRLWQRRRASLLEAMSKFAVGAAKRAK